MFLDRRWVRESSAGDSQEKAQRNRKPATRGFNMNKPIPWTRLIGYLVIYKLLFWNIAVFSLPVLPLNRDSFELHLSYPLEGEPTLESRFATWDAAHYLYLAEYGYHARSPSCAFYPLWPMLIRGVWKLVGGSPVVVGLILANLLSIAGLTVFYRFAVERMGPEAALWSLIVLCAFPGAIFFSLIYTESLYLLLLMGFFWLVYRRRYGWAAVVGFFLPLTKAMGIFVTVPTAYLLCRRKELFRFGWVLGIVGLGYVTYFGLIWGWTGSPFSGFTAQRAYPNQPSIWNLVNLPLFLQRVVHVTGVHNVTGSLLDRLVFGVWLATLWPLWKWDRTLFLYAALAGYIPAAATGFVSYQRQVMMCFPMFWILGRWMAREESRWWRWHGVGLLAIVQWCFLVRYLAFDWTA